MVIGLEEKLVSAVQALYLEDQVSRAFFDAAADRKNDVAETTIERIAQMAEVGRHEAVGLARRLEEAGCGRLLVGRKGWKTRFQWDYSLPGLGHAAKGDAEEVNEVDPDVKADAADQQPATSQTNVTTSRLTIAEAKRGLAEALGISPDNIEITIRG